MRRKRITLGLAVLVAFSLSAIAAGANDTIMVQGMLRDANGVPLANGDYSMSFVLYDAKTTGTELWRETHTVIGGNAVTISAGCFSVALGELNPFSATFFSDNQILWLEIIAEINANLETFSRMQLGSVPFAKVATSLQGPVDADTLDGMDSSAFAFAGHMHNLQDMSGAVTDAQVPDDITVNYAAAAGRLSGIGSGTQDVTIYVNDEYGNDNNDGLSTDKPKKTIQAAVNMLLPPLRCNVTIDITEGIYREEVKVFGISVAPGKSLTFQGDESWTPSSPSDPSVRITGTDDDVTHTGVRNHCFVAANCFGVVLKGILFDYAKAGGVRFHHGSYSVYNCKAGHNDGGGIELRTNSSGVIKYCLAEQNEGDAGIYIRENSYVVVENTASKSNSNFGVFIDILCSVIFRGSGDYSGNGRTGIHVSAKSCVWFTPEYSGQIQNNSEYGVWVRYDSYTSSHTRNTFLNNTLGNTHTDHNGNLY